MKATQKELFQLRKRAEKVTEIIKLMNEVFPTLPEENQTIAIMGCIQDAYYRGVMDEIKTPKK